MENQNLALKYKLVSLSNPTLNKMPGVSLSGDIAEKKITMKRTGSTSTAAATLTQTIADENILDPELRDQSFIVKMPHWMVELAGTDITPESIDSDNIATYIVTRSYVTNATGASSLTLDLQARSVSDSVFTTFGDTDNKEQISREIEVTGMQSGTSTSIALALLK